MAAKGHPSFVAVQQYYGGWTKIAKSFTGANGGNEENTRHTEIARRNLIPTSQAREIVREFFETGRRSTSVKWQQLQ